MHGNKLLSRFQTTINHQVSCYGVGLHSGNKVNLTLVPAEAGTGIVFRRVDYKGQVISQISANYKNIKNTSFCTSIIDESNQNEIHTIEHLMAALWGCGIDNIFIDLDHDEVPIMDGSSYHFVHMIECSGTHFFEEPRKILRVNREVSLTLNDIKVKISPHDDFAIDMAIDFDNRVIAKQNFSFARKNNFKKDLSRARTFCLEKDINQMWDRGLAKGGSLDNAIVVGEDKVINQDGLRYDNEFVRHKILDCIGDMYLAGYHILGKFEGSKSGHKSNNLLLHELFSSKQNYDILKIA